MRNSHWARRALCSGLLIAFFAGALALLPSAIAATAPPGPTNLRVTDIRASGANLTWTAPKDTTNLYGYTIVNLLASATDNQVGSSFTTTGTANLKPQTTYKLAVYATYVVSTTEDSQLSNTVTITTPADTTPPTPPTLQAPWHTASSIGLTWSGATDDVGVDSFQISDGTQTWEQSAINYSWQRTLSGLATNRTYTLTIRARDVAGNFSAPSNSVSVLIEDQSPSAPANLRVENGKLVWDRATDNSGTITGYDVFYDGSSPYASTTGTSVPLQQTFDPMQGSYFPTAGSHTFTVKARDPSGNISAPSNTVTATVPSATGG
jgi:hypothetical protein